MTAQRFSDAELRAALRRVSPSVAQADLRGRIRSEVQATTQQGALPPVLALLGDADPFARRRVLLFAAMLLLALSVSIALAVGAALNTRPPERQLSLEPPTDLGAFVQSSYDRLAEVPAMSITTLEDGTIKARFLYDGVGIVRYEHYDRSTTPQSYRLIARDQTAEENTLENGERVWVVSGAPPYDPRQEIAMATGVTTFCERGWTYVGLEPVMNRPTHHLACGRDLWIDPESLFVLRSREHLTDNNGEPLPNQFRTLEVTAFEFGPQPPELFDLTPAGLRVMTDREYNCSFTPDEPDCVNPPPATPTPVARPLVMPEPAIDAAPPSLDAAGLVARALETYAELPPIELLIDEYDTAGGAGMKWHRFFDGTAAVRSELIWDPTGEGEPTIFLTLDGHTYESYAQEDGSTIWYDWGEREGPFMADFVLGIGAPCPEGWVHVSVDLVLERPADHLTCGLREVWIDREWNLVTRAQRNPDALETQTRVEEVLEVRFGPSPDELFELPPGDEVSDTVPR